MKTFRKKIFILMAAFFLLNFLELNKIDAADFSKTVKFFIIQEKEAIIDGVEINKNFTISIAENNPQITSAFIEIKGIAIAGAATTGIVNVKLDSDPYALYNTEVATIPKRFTVIHDITSIIFPDFPGIPGNKNYTLYIRNDNFNTTNLSAKLILTYKYNKSTGTLPVSGSIISSTFDTEINDGAAYNSMMWKGSLNGGIVRLQIASSECSNGAANYPACDTGSWMFKGPDCTSNDYYQGLPDASYKIKCLDHNNKRYFRYKIMLCSDNCSISGSNNPTVTDVIVNWSP